MIDKGHCEVILASNWTLLRSLVFSMSTFDKPGPNESVRTPEGAPDDDPQREHQKQSFYRTRADKLLGYSQVMLIFSNYLTRYYRIKDKRT